MKKIFFISISVILAAAPVKLSAFEAIDSPAQPLSGPGGKDYKYSQIVSYFFKEDNNEYWIIEPGDSLGASLPVIVFCHAWGGGNPANYSAWIGHLAKKGNFVIFPKFQNGISDNPANFTSAAIQSISAAFNRIKSNSSKFYSKPDLNKMAIIGHSAGGVVAVNIAALASKSKLPAPKAVMSVAPATAPSPSQRLTGSLIKFEDLKQLSGIKLLVSEGDGDSLAPADDAQRIISESVNIPQSNKDFVLIKSDSQSRKNLTADHFIPCGSSSDALDYFGIWKLFDGLRDSTFYGKNVQYALGNTSQQRFMGYWSNGVPVKELEVVKMADSAVQPSSQEESPVSSSIFSKGLFGQFLSNFNKWKK